MKKRSEIGDSSKKTGCADWKARKRTWQYVELRARAHFQFALQTVENLRSKFQPARRARAHPVFLLVATVAVGCS